MKKNFKKTLAKVMAVALTVSMVASAPNADAAKKIKLSSKSVTVTKGKTKKVTIKNVKAKKVKKLTVKSSKKSIATVKKNGKTAFKVTGKKAGTAKITATVKVKGQKKATKLTLTVKVKNAVAQATTPTTAPTAVATAAPTAASTTAPGGSTQTTTPATQTPEESATPAPTPPAQPEKPSTPAKELPELNIREEAATPWSVAGSYGTAIFNTDDTVSFSSMPWAGSKPDVYNNGISWYIDATTKDAVDLSAYDAVELTIKTDAEVKIMTWGGASDVTSFWDKKDSWGASSKTVENADGSKTVTYPLDTIFGNAKKIQKATAIGLTLKSNVTPDSTEFAAKTATIYGFKFISTGEKPSTDTGSVESGDIESGDITEPIATFSASGYKSFADMGVTLDTTKTYSNIILKIKAYNAAGDLITPENENYANFKGYSKVTVGNATTIGDGTSNGAGGNTENYSATWAMYFLNNVGLYGVVADTDGYITIDLDMYNATEGAYIPTSSYDGLGFQSTTNAAGIPKIEIYDIQFVQVEAI